MLCKQEMGLWLLLPFNSDPPFSSVSPKNKTKTKQKKGAGGTILESGGGGGGLEKSVWTFPWIYPQINCCSAILELHPPPPDSYKKQLPTPAQVLLDIKSPLPQPHHPLTHRMVLKTIVITNLHLKAFLVSQQCDVFLKAIDRKANKKYELFCFSSHFSSFFTI